MRALVLPFSLMLATGALADDCHVGSYRLSDGRALDLARSDEGTMRWRMEDGSSGQISRAGDEWRSTLGWTGRDETKAGAPRFVRPGSISPALHRVGTVVLPDDADSVVIIVYGDNRPGFRMMTTAWGVPAVMNGFTSPELRQFIWGVVNIPVAVIQFFFPRLDGPRDLITGFWTHLYTGGNERQVIKAVERDLPANFVVQTGDVVENGRHEAPKAMEPEMTRLGLAGQFKQIVHQSARRASRASGSRIPPPYKRR